MYDLRLSMRTNFDNAYYGKLKSPITNIVSLGNEIVTTSLDGNLVTFDIRNLNSVCWERNLGEGNISIDSDNSFITTVNNGKLRIFDNHHIISELDVDAMNSFHALNLGDSVVKFHDDNSLIVSLNDKLQLWNFH
jgi:hypothetical protein